MMLDNRFASGTKILDSSDSSSTIDLSHLNVKLSADISMGNPGKSKNDLLNDLKNDPTVWDIQEGAMSHKTKSASDPRNTGLILSELENSQYGPITDKMSFKGNIKTNGTPGKIDFYYDGSYWGTINVKTY